MAEPVNLVHSPVLKAKETIVTTDEFAKALAALVVQAKEAGLEEPELIAELRRQADAMQQRIDG